ncbi:polyketide cyclase [Flavobacterium sp. Sd200]|uniref:SRPBCC family protein n=1 Tax=Flavobacterium sp. Sd200 TaxID=2692211 RepID=UPI00136C2D35|nr:SRPBCC family protein [Flavobacterium sp. Sd200]MXN91037.1 polyketide cyclase [Flavobacterium sp. Sd200]
MKVLKIILIIILALIALPLIAALFVSKDYYIERSIVINKPRPEVFDYVARLKNQKDYSVWVQADPNMKQEFIGTDGTVGFVNTWNGNEEVGEGSQKITAIVPNERVDVTMHFIRPFEDFMDGSTITKDTVGGTKVTNIVKGVSAYPMNIMNPFLDDMIAPDIEKNLSNLKNVLEK